MIYARTLRISLLIVACTLGAAAPALAQEDDTPADPSEPGDPDPGDPGTTPANPAPYIVALDSDLEARATELAPGQYVVQLVQADETVVFEGDFQPGVDGQEELQYAFTAGGEGVNRTTASSLSVPVDAPTSADAAIASALVVHSFVVQAQNAEQSGNAALDNYGCDLTATQVALLALFRIDGNSCGGYGGCCDAHDSCYLQYSCTWLSWLGLTANASTCNRECNSKVVRCMTGKTAPGASTCCGSSGSSACGQPRAPD